MSLSANIRVLSIPPHLQDEMWPHVAPWLTKGLAAAHTSTLDEIRRDLANGTDHLWAVFENDTLVAAFVTAIYVDQGSYLGVYALGGRGLRHWAREIDQTMQAEAKRCGVDRVRFAGRRGWSRVLPGLVLRGALQGHDIYERAVA
jgi:hypothetical protein